MRLLRVVSSRLLPCGCFVGIYERYDQQAVAIIDQASERCPAPSHRNGTAVPVVPVPAARVGLGPDLHASTPSGDVT